MAIVKHYTCTSFSNGVLSSKRPKVKTKRDHKQYDDNRANTSEQNRKKFGRSNIEMVLLNRKKLAFTLICHVMTWVDQLWYMRSIQSNK
ncbi:hypothetical protein BLOT_016599 [Blomia tropicalis]|nr:hypothetical protein BLOT_016599 [Blomia tropicalis]